MKYLVFSIILVILFSNVALSQKDSEKSKAISYLKKIAAEYKAHASYEYKAVLTAFYIKDSSRYSYPLTGRAADSVTFITSNTKDWVTYRDYTSLLVDLDSIYYIFPNNEYSAEPFHDENYTARSLSIWNDMSAMDVNKKLLKHFQHYPAKDISLRYETSDSVAMRMYYSWPDTMVTVRDSMYLEVVINPKTHTLIRVVNWFFNGGNSGLFTLEVHKFTFSNISFDREKYLNNIKQMKRRSR